MANLIKIAGVEDLLPGQAGAFTVEGRRIALFNVEGTYYAIGDSCTHRGGPLSEGDAQGTKVTCPWHGADFDLKTGDDIAMTFSTWPRSLSTSKTGTPRTAKPRLRREVLSSVPFPKSEAPCRTENKRPETRKANDDLSQTQFEESL